MSLFIWDGCKLTLRSNSKPIFNWSINIILLLEFTFRMKTVSVLVAKGDINLFLFQILFMIRIIAHLVMRLNTWIFRTDLARLINQTGAIDIQWGKTSFVIFHRRALEIVYLCPAAVSNFYYENKPYEALRIEAKLSRA